MLLSIVIVSAVILFVILPLAVLTLYYSPRDYSLGKNLLWIIVALITWPLVPIVIAAKKDAKYLLAWFWLSFLVLVVSGSYWLVLNVNTVLAFQKQYFLY